VLEDGRTYQFSVRAEDRAGNEEENTQSASSVVDSKPPSIVHTPIVGLLEQEIVDVAIEATVTDASGLDMVELHYRRRGAASYTDVKMAEGASNVYEADIPSSAFSSAGVDYYISASDEAGNLSEHPVQTIAVGTTLRIPIDASGENEILLGDGSSFYLPAGAVAKDTHLIITIPKSIPPPQTGLGKHILTRDLSIADVGATHASPVLSKPIKFILRYSDRRVAGEDESKLAIYLWNSERWDYISNVNPQENSVTVNTLNLSIFSIIGDYTPPVVADLRPSGYAEPDVMITAKVEDSGSGIDLENMEVQLDGQSVAVPPTALKDGKLSLGFPGELKRGSHSLQVIVSDKAGNQTVATSRFEIVGGLTLKDVFCYPNPFRPTRGMHFAYTLTESVKGVTIRIFGMDGKLVRKIDGTASVGENLVPWDGKDEAGDTVLSSVYICHIEAEGDRETKSEKIKIAGWE
jgi:hypothetical protein